MISSLWFIICLKFTGFNSHFIFSTHSVLGLSFSIAGLGVRPSHTWFLRSFVERNLVGQNWQKKKKFYILFCDLNGTEAKQHKVNIIWISLKWMEKEKNYCFMFDFKINLSFIHINNKFVLRQLKSQKSDVLFRQSGGKKDSCHSMQSLQLCCTGQIWRLNTLLFIWHFPLMYYLSFWLYLLPFVPSHYHTISLPANNHK